MSAQGERFDAVVIGSGFGGAINARRLAEAGKSVLVLERGRRYRPGEFPRDVRATRELFWRYPRHAADRGLYELNFFSGIGVVSASGVGGGSLVYANIHIRPDEIVFDDPRWPDWFTRRNLDPYYDKVAETMGIAPVPDDVVMDKRDVYRSAAVQNKRSVFDPDQAVSWDDPDQPGRRACQYVAECEFGCNFGAKNSLDFTYLARAESQGAELRSGSNVTHIEPDGDGYRVHYTDLASGDSCSVAGRRVVLAAGTLGTNLILLSSRDSFQSLPALSHRLGFGFSGNGDFLGSIQSSQQELEPWNGPDVTSVIRYFDEAPHFTMAAPTFNKAAMEVLASLGQGSLGLPRLLADWLWPKTGGLLVWAFRRGLLSKPLRFPGPKAGNPARMTNLFAIGRDNANGKIRLGKGGLDIDWNYAAENEELVNKMTRAMEDVNDYYGGTVAPLASWNLFKRILTVHPLGGCHLSESPDRGVVSLDGEVHGYPGLFVADGSVIPSSIGFHPVMTISAVAERIAEAVVAYD